MAGSKSQTWIIGTVLVALLIFVSAWFLLVSPRQARTDEARADNEAALFEQDQLRSRLAVLEEQATHLDEYQGEIDALSVQIPPEPRIPDYVRSLQGLADQYGVTITALSPSFPIAFGEAVGATVVVTPTPTGTEDAAGTDPVGTAEDTATAAQEASDEAAGETAVEPAPATPETTAASGLFAIPVGIQVVGTYTNVCAFLEGMQTQTGRVFLVTVFDAIAQDAQDSQGGRPATAPGDVELTINGFLYEYLDSTSVSTDQTEEPAEPAPLPSSERNPFASITGS